MKIIRKIPFISILPEVGKLSGSKNEELLTLNFPSDEFKEITLTDEITNGFDLKPIAAYKGKTDYFLVFEKEEQIMNIKPNLKDISKIKGRGVIISTKGNNVDFISRFFAPQSGIDEDPVTGSAHTTLTPYWSTILNKTELSAIQLSARKGYLFCKFLGEQVEISGECKLYMAGEIYL